MNSLVIELGLSLVENVTSAIIEKLYNLAITSKVLDLSNSFSMSLKGSIYVNSAYESSVLYLREKFPYLTITVRDNNFYIKFADSNVENILVQSLYCTDHVGFSLNDATLMTNIPAILFKENTNISTFNELNKFGSISLDNSAFYNCTNLTSINLSTVTSIGLLAFKGCTSLAQVISIPNLVSLGEEAFMNSGITQVTNLGNTISNIPNSCFRNCSALTSFTVSSNVTSLGSNAFSYCSNLTTFDFSNILSTGVACFSNSGLSGTLNIPNLSGDLSKLSFRNTNISEITNLGTITSIGNGSRSGSSEGVFLGCTSLTSAIIPSTVTVIGADTFANCNNLALITCNWLNITSIGASAFLMSANWGSTIMSLTNLTSLGNNAIGRSRDVRNIRLIYIPKLTTSYVGGYYLSNYYYSGAFTGITCDILYLRDIEDLHPGDFALCHCANLVINNVTPPVWKNTNNVDDSEVTNDVNRKSRVINGSSITNIYVPDSAVTTYLNDSNWSEVFLKIKSINELSKVATEADLLNDLIALIEAYM